MSGFGGFTAGLEEYSGVPAGVLPVADGPRPGPAGGSRARRPI
jgi:hypothetical protein